MVTASFCSAFSSVRDLVMRMGRNVKSCAFLALHHSSATCASPPNKSWILGGIGPLALVGRKDDPSLRSARPGACFRASPRAWACSTSAFSAAERCENRSPAERSFVVWVCWLFEGVQAGPMGGGREGAGWRGDSVAETGSQLGGASLALRGSLPSQRSSWEVLGGVRSRRLLARGILGRWWLGCCGRGGRVFLRAIGLGV